MINTCDFIITLNNWWSPFKICIPGADNSNLIRTEKAVPIIPAKTANIKYNVPISLAFVEKSHLIMLNFYFLFISLALNSKYIAMTNLYRYSHMRNRGESNT